MVSWAQGERGRPEKSKDKTPLKNWKIANFFREKKDTKQWKVSEVSSEVNAETLERDARATTTGGEAKLSLKMHDKLLYKHRTFFWTEKKKVIITRFTAVRRLWPRRSTPALTRQQVNLNCRAHLKPKKIFRQRQQDVLDFPLSLSLFAWVKRPLASLDSF